MKTYLIYLVIVNIIGFVMMYSDKKRAIRKEWRIPEKTLFMIAIIGGSIGSIVGMNVFRHKTKHSHFKYGIPIILMIQIGLIYRLLFYK